jgi:hypothetical protein
MWHFYLHCRSRRAEVPPFEAAHRQLCFASVMMKLGEKGSFAPRPTLEGPTEPLARAVESWPGVVARTHWELGDESIVDGADFYVGDQELGHIHLYAEVHLALPRKLADAVIAAKLAGPFRWSAAFVVKKVRTADDAAEAEWLFTLGYDRLRGVALETLLARVTAEGGRSAERRTGSRSGVALRESSTRG